KRRNRRPKLSVCDKFFRILARWFWSDWRRSPFAVAPAAVVGWHRAGFRLYWSMIQDPQAGGQKEELPGSARSAFPHGGRGEGQTTRTPHGGTPAGTHTITVTAAAATA